MQRRPWADLAQSLLPIQLSRSRSPGSATLGATKAGLRGTVEPLHILGEGRDVAVSSVSPAGQKINRGTKALGPILVFLG